MQKLDLLFKEYSADHQNPLNQKIHYICVPLIVYSIMGLLWCIPQIQVLSVSVNWAWIFALGSLVYYFLLNVKLALFMIVFVSICFSSFYYMTLQSWPLATLSFAVFVLAWIGQFYGHKVEGKKPSFLTDLKYLFIGPLWVLKKTISKR